MLLLPEEEFVLDNVMFWESYRWETFDRGHIYMQKFPSGKLYVGQTIDINDRFRKYKRLVGSNPHHTNALKKHGWDNVMVEIVSCPKYLLDAIEIFLIGFMDLMDPDKGYNKQSGGRHNGYHMSLETRTKISESNAGENNPMYGRRGDLSPIFGEKHPMYGRRGELSPVLGEKNGMYGKKHTDEARQMMSEKCANPGEKNGMFNKNHTNEAKQKMSEAAKKRTGEKSSRGIAVCVFGKLYGSASIASDMLREECDTISNGNFIKAWAKSKKHKEYCFYVTKEFYILMKDSEEYITRAMYDEYLATL